MTDKAFDSGDYHCIIFYPPPAAGYKWSVWALPKDLQSGPEYCIKSNHNAALKDIVTRHLQDHPELGLKIEDFS